MKINEKLRQLREENHWSQEEMAERMNMSPSGYAKIERGETKLNLDKLQNIAQIFNIDIIELMNNDSKSVVFHMNENNGCNSSGTNYYQSTNNEVLVKEIEHLNTLLKEKDKQIQMLEEIVQLLKQG
ncbi:Predicted transcriptional regulator [Moraxella lacunata]|uniref:Predicted transcriptional regulator n=1 Tax=Moraxella lacunata TaxID=477 RepID=A0A378TTC5_MORLA|nr:helix-turn-helix transcriptional regulator [Moraxella lacunata]STZ64078.1 Predicted transcriptional regulator [Moraxella lacunata]